MLGEGGEPSKRPSSALIARELTSCSRAAFTVVAAPMPLSAARRMAEAVHHGGGQQLSASALHGCAPAPPWSAPGASHVIIAIRGQISHPRSSHKMYQCPLVVLQSITGAPRGVTRRRNNIGDTSDHNEVSGLNDTVLSPRKRPMAAIEKQLE